jgi:hypothetical protein
MSEQARAEQQIAWELHVELATRIAVTPLPADQGLLGEALASLAAMAGQSRQILYDHQPDPDPASVGFQAEAIAQTVLGEVVDPFLAQWQPRLQAWMADRPAATTKPDHERAWPRADVLRTELAGVQARLRPLAERLAELADAASLVR